MRGVSSSSVRSYASHTVSEVDTTHGFDFFSLSYGVSVGASLTSADFRCGGKSGSPCSSSSSISWREGYVNSFLFVEVHTASKRSARDIASHASSGSSVYLKCGLRILRGLSSPGTMCVSREFSLLEGARLLSLSYLGIPSSRLVSSFEYSTGAPISFLCFSDTTSSTAVYRPTRRISSRFPTARQGS